MGADNADIVFEENDKRLKVTLPVRASRLALALHSLALVVWLAMLATVLVYLVGGMSSTWVLTIILLIWSLVWIWFGRFLWTRWQYHAATREILFVDEEQLVIRRPVSILGSTTAYDKGHVSPFYYSEQHHCPAFDYAYLHVYFGRTLSERQARDVVDELNRRCFPDNVRAATEASD